MSVRRGNILTQTNSQMSHLFLFFKWRRTGWRHTVLNGLQNPRSCPWELIDILRNALELVCNPSGRFEMRQFRPFLLTWFALDQPETHHNHHIILHSAIYCWMLCVCVCVCDCDAMNKPTTIARKGSWNC